MHVCFFPPGDSVIVSSGVKTHIWIEIQVMPPICCATLGELLPSSVPQFSHTRNKVIHNSDDDDDDDDDRSCHLLRFNKSQALHQKSLNMDYSGKSP